MPDGVSLVQREGGERRPGHADENAGAAQIARHGKALLIGDVVADEQRRAAGHGRAAHQRADGAALVAAAGTPFVEHIARVERGVEPVRQAGGARSAERRGGKEWGTTCRSRWSHSHEKTKKTIDNTVAVISMTKNNQIEN